MSTWNDIITLALEDLGAIRPGEVYSTAIRDNCFTRIQDLVSSLSTEGATVFTETLQPFTLTAGVSDYTLGTAGNWTTALRAQKVVAWKANSGLFTSGGKALDFDEFDAAAMAIQIKFAEAAAKVSADEAALAASVKTAMASFFQTPVFTFPAIALESANVPMILGANTAYPTIAVRVFPAPVANGTAEITYWTPITQPVAVGDAVSLPPGWEDMLHFNLAVKILPRYGRQGFNPQVLLANAQNTKASIVAQNKGLAQAAAE